MKRILLTIVIILLFIAISTPEKSAAITRFVVSDSSQCSSLVTSTNPNDLCYTSAQSAMNDALAATSSDTIEIWPGTYSLIATITKDIPIHGVETARTFLTGGGSGTILTLTSVSSLMAISKLTFINATIGIQISSGSPAIENNIFEVGSSSTAIQISSAATPTSITNNTFYLNGAAISSSQTAVPVINNIFANNTTAISANVDVTTIQNNLFSANTNIGPTIVFDDPLDPTTDWRGNLSEQNLEGDSDPDFVHRDNDIAKRDFHLLAGSPAIGAGHTSADNNTINGSPPDIGAYGGGGSDIVPFPVSITSATETPTPSINLTWSTNNSYFIQRYSVYYSLNKTGPPYEHTRDTDPTFGLDVDSSTTSMILTNVAAATQPATPSITSVEFANQTLKISWGQVSGATDYKIFYIDETAAPGVEQSTPPVGNVTSFNLTGLINLHDYRLAVVAIAQNNYHIAVTTSYNNNANRKPGEQYESAYSPEAVVTVGAAVESTKAFTTQTYFPEAVTPNPNLLNKGCFIATAAYGYYSAPQVQALREFRDRYLTTNAPGRAFVRWYYTYGPVGAQFINENPWLKPVVRTALMPAVGGAMFMTRTSMFTKVCVFAFICLLATCSVWVYPRRKSLRPR